MIFLATDFGGQGLYSGQVRLVLERLAPGVPVIEMFSDLPVFSPRLSAPLIRAYLGPDRLEKGDVVLGVVDPGVGGSRAGIMACVNGVWYVGPDNGLFSLVLRHRSNVQVWKLPEPSLHTSSTFHGRDVFAPVVAGLTRGILPENICDLRVDDLEHMEWPDDVDQIVYIDSYGNAITGRRASTVNMSSRFCVGKTRNITRARTFGDVGAGQVFWYENANGLVEIAVNQGRADTLEGIHAGARLDIT